MKKESEKGTKPKEGSDLLGAAVQACEEAGKIAWGTLTMRRTTTTSWVNFPGILKDCQFAPVANPHRQTVQIQSALNGDNTKFNATQRYDVNIKCKGFQYFKPGQIIFVDTQLIGFGDSMHPGDIAADYNLGGYYLIIKAGHEFVGMDFETNITAKFINNGRSV